MDSCKRKKGKMYDAAGRKERGLGEFITEMHLENWEGTHGIARESSMRNMRVHLSVVLVFFFVVVELC